MDKFLEVLATFNLPTVCVLTAIFWYFTRDLKSEMRLLEAKIDKQADRTDRLYEMFVSLQKETKDIVINILKERK